MSDRSLDDMQPSNLLEPNYEEMIEEDEKAKPTELLPSPEQFDLPTVIVEELEKKPMQSLIKGPEEFGNLKQMPEAMMEVKEEAKQQAEDVRDDMAPVADLKALSVEDITPTIAVPGPSMLLPVPKGFDLPVVIVEGPDQNPMQGPRQGLETALDSSFLFEGISDAEFEIDEETKKQTEEFWDNLPFDSDLEPLSIDDVLPVTKEPRQNELLLPPGEFDVPSPNVNDDDLCENLTSSPNSWLELNMDENAQRELERKLFERFMKKLSKEFKDETEELQAKENETKLEEDSNI